MSKVQFSEKAWEDYPCWQSQDKRTLKKLNALIRDIQRSPFSGTGKPEPLKGEMSGLWSRRMDDVNRVVYSLDNDIISISSCRGHYDD